MHFIKSFAKAAFVGSFISVLSAVPVLAETAGVVQGDNVNVRADASTASDIITTFNAGQALSIQGVQGDFFKIAYNGNHSYIAKQFVELHKIEAKVNDTGINIRKKPSTTAEIVGSAYKDEVYTVTDAEDDWYAIEFQGSRAYIKKEFLSSELLTLLSPSSNPPPPAKKPEPVAAEPEVIPEPVAVPEQQAVPEPVTVPEQEAVVEPVIIPEQPVVIEQAIIPEQPIITEQGIVPEQAITPELESIPEAEDILMGAPEPVVSYEDEEPVFAVIQSNNGLRLRSDASTEADVLTVLSYYAVADVIEQGSEWTKVDFNGNQGYVSTEFISLQNEYPTVVSQAQDIIAYGRQFLGTPYAWSGTNLKRGVDCSGFVYSVMGHFGLYIGRSSRDMVQYGVKIDKAGLIPGDLVFFDTTNSRNRGYISHVGIYMGNGNFIHSSSSRRTWGVTISSLYEDYYIRTYVTARRVLS